MEDTEQANITLVVRNEEELYTSYSPVPEFNYSVMGYIRSKIGEAAEEGNMSLTVISKEPLDEERFWTAARNWIKDEKRLFKMEQKNNLRTLIGLLVVGSILIIASISLQQFNELLRYTLLPVMGSLALSRSARILILEMPVVNAKQKIIKQIEQSNKIIFKYGDDTYDASEDKESSQTNDAK